jgi:hypothetical protein
MRMMMIMGHFVAKFHCNCEITEPELQHARDHVLTAEELNTGWHYRVTHATRLGIRIVSHSTSTPPPPSTLVIRSVSGSPG